AINGLGETAPSAEVNGTTTFNQGTLVLSWGAVPNATRYAIYRGTLPGTETLVATVIGGNTTSFTDAGTAAPPTNDTTGLKAPILSPLFPTAGGTLSTTTTYFYVVTAFNAKGETTPSSEQSGQPSGTFRTFEVGWSQVPGATGYRVYRGTSQGSEDTLIAQIQDGTVTTFTDDGGLTVGAPPLTN